MSEKSLFNKTQKELTEEEMIAVENSDTLYLAIYNNTVDQMYEITDEMKQFASDHPYRSQDGIGDPRQIKVMAHYFNPAFNQDWIITEYCESRNGQHYFYGCARLFDDVGWEWGTLPSLEELRSIDLGPAFGHLRIEKDESVQVGDSLYDVMMAIDRDGLYDLGLMERSQEDIDRIIDFEKQKFALLRNIVDDDMYDRIIYYLYKENADIDDVFDIDRYYYDRDNCLDEDRISEFYETHEFPGYEPLIYGMKEDGMTDNQAKDLIKALGKASGMDYGKEL